MKSLQDVIRQKEHELEQAVEDAVRAKEVELVRLRKTLQEALETVDRLLETVTAPEGNTADSASSIPALASPMVKPAVNFGRNNGGSAFP